jgi:hypothetical protein
LVCLSSHTSTVTADASGGTLGCSRQHSGMQVSVLGPVHFRALAESDLVSRADSVVPRDCLLTKPNSAKALKCAGSSTGMHIPLLHHRLLARSQI